jgi:hypothetical protein
LDRRIALNRWLRRLGAIPRLLVAYAALREDVQEALSDPAIRAAVEKFRKDPDIQTVFPRISAEWRAVEEAVNQMR